MTYPISMIPYANVGPFRALGPPDGCVFVDTNPRDSSIGLKQGTLLAAPVPVGALPHLKNEVEYIGAYGIAANGEVESVLFFSKLPFEQIDSRARIYLTHHSASSIRLLYLLLGYQNGFDNLPVATASEQDTDGHLLIGDRALLDAPKNIWPYVTDLAQAWFKITRLPFVFARWVMRQDAPDTFKQRMRGWLAEFESREKELIRTATGIEAQRIGMDIEKMRSYLQRLIYVFGPNELKGQELFFKELARYQRVPLFPEDPAGEK